jgi:hypothetical protein
LRRIIGQRELVETGLADEPRLRERQAPRIIDSFLARLDDARDEAERAQAAPGSEPFCGAKVHHGRILTAHERKRVSLGPSGNCEHAELACSQSDFVVDCDFPRRSDHDPVGCRRSSHE